MFLCSAWVEEGRKGCSAWWWLDGKQWRAAASLSDAGKGSAALIFGSSARRRLRGTGGACRRHEVPGRGGWSKTRGAEAVLAEVRRTWPVARDGAVPDVRRRANAVRKREW